MLKKWTTNRLVKNWKKTLAVLFWQSVILLSFAQSNQQLAEISLADGLPSSSARKLIELSNGTAAVATDAGIFFLPNNQNNLNKISQAIGVQQCWDLYEEEGLLYIATYNDGLYIYEMATGNLINHYDKNKLPKIRRFRQINQSLYAIARNGIWRITQSGIFNIFDAKSWMLPGNMPMDIFFFNQKLHVLSYPERIIYEQQTDQSWSDLSKSLQKLGRKINNFDFANLVSFVFQNKVFLGSVNYYMVMDSAYHFQKYELPLKHNESWAFWDFREHNGIIYGAVTNTNNFEDGCLHIHNPKVHTYNPPHQNPIWSITPSRFKDALWLCTENKGVLLLQQPKSLIPTTHHFEKKFASNNFIVGVDNNHIAFFEKNKDSKWKSHSIPDQIRSVIEINRNLYLYGSDYLWIYHPHTDKLSKSILTTEFQWMTSIGQTIYFFKPYDKIYIFHPEKNNSIQNTNYDAMSDAIVMQDHRIIFHKMGQGFGFIDSTEQYHELRCNKVFNQYTLQFHVSGNQLIIQNGNSIELYIINFNKNTLKFIEKIDLSIPFLDLNILKIIGTIHGFHLFTGDYIFTIRFFQNGKRIHLLHQQYLGQWNTNEWLFSDGNQFSIDRGDAIQVITQSKKNQPNFRSNYSINNAAFSKVEGLLSINLHQNFQITAQGSNYFDIQRSLFELYLQKLNTNATEILFFTGNRYRWINAIPVGRYKLTIASQSRSTSSFIWSTLIFYKDLPFWFIVLFFALLLFYYFNYQTKTKGSLNRRIVLLQLKTLQNNFNPHFIFNSMSLIQSLIIGDQQKKAIDVTAKLANLNRTFLQNSNNDLIPLKDEIDFILKYVEMERLRFESDFEFEFNIHTTKKFPINSWRIPPMILQPLVENAIKHGILINPKNKTIDLYIRAKIENFLEIQLENKYVKPRKKNPSGMGMGLKLVADRLLLLCELYPKLFRTSFHYGIENDDRFVVRILIERILSNDDTIQQLDQADRNKTNNNTINGGGAKYNISMI
jgi:sensor histidine kinase YesM